MKRVVLGLTVIACVVIAGFALRERLPVPVESQPPSRSPAPTVKRAPAHRVPESVSPAPALASAATPAATAPPTHPFHERRQSLEQRAAAGDMQAAAELGGVLAICANYSRTSVAELEEVVVSGMASDVEPPRIGGAAISPEMLVLMLQEGMQELDRRCQGTEGAIPGIERSTALQWLVQAADAGNADAMYDYVRFAFEDYSGVDAMLRDASTVLARKRRARSYVDQLIRRGDVRGLLLRTDSLTRGGLMPRDPVAAYANVHAYLHSAASQQWSPPLRQLYLQALARELDPAQLAQAQAQGDALWRDCCARQEHP